MNVVYQLTAEGLDRMNETRKRKLYSSTVFTTREGAERRIEKFRVMVTDPKNIWGLTNKYPVEITVEEREIIND